MPCDDILLHIQGYPDQTTRSAIDAAVTLAEGLSGRISAFAVELAVGYMPNLVFDHLVGMQGIAKETMERSAAGCREGLDYFRARAAAAGILNDTSAVAADMGLEALKRAQEARAFDFSIYCPSVGGPDQVLAETLILMSGRPVIVLPHGHEGALGNVVLAWDGSAPAARAMNDALPVFKAARAVTVLTVTGDKQVDHIAPADHAVRHLRRHGVRAHRVEIEPEGRSTAAALEHHLKAERADMIVMGAFGHSRFREVLLGGVTEHMLAEAPAAVWLSH
jgi:nucleotide-binding universal stress UspA family protein